MKSTYTGTLAAITLAIVHSIHGYDFNMVYLAGVTRPAENSQSLCLGAKGLWDQGTKQCYLSMEYAAIAAAGLLAAEHFNEGNGDYIPEFETLSKTCKLKVKPRIVDTAFEPDNAVAGVIGLLGIPDIYRIHGVIGAAASASSMPTSLISGALDIPQISYWSTSTSLDNDGLYKRFMRTIPSDAAVANSICEFWVSLKYKNAAVVFVNDGYGEAFKEAITMYCLQKGMQSIKTYPLVEGDKSQIMSQVTKLANTKLNIILVVAGEGVLSDVVNSALAQNTDMFTGSQWVLSDGISSHDFSSLSEGGKKALNGSLRVLAAGGTSGNPSWVKFQNDWRSVDGSFLDSYFTGAWKKMSAQIFSNIDPDSNEVKVPGAFMYDAVAAFILGTCNMSKSENKFPHISETVAYGGADNVFGTKFKEQMKYINFRGLTGQVKFDNIGNRDLKSSSYEMYNVHYDGDSLAYSNRHVAYFSGSTWKAVEGQAIHFNRGSTEVPLDIDLPVEDKNYSDSIRGVCIALGCINIFIAFCFIVWSIAHRDHLVVKCSQVHFLVCIAFGIMVSSSSIFLFTVDDRNSDSEASRTGENSSANAACMGSIWMYGIGFVLIFGPLFAKLWRIQRIFKNKNMQRIIIPSSLLILMVLGFLVVEMTILTSWTIIDPLKFYRRVTLTDEFTNPVTSIGVCDGKNPLPFLITIGAFHFLILIVLNYISYRTRKINLKFAESTYIGLIMTSYIQIILVAVPVLVIVSENPMTNMFVRSGVIFLNDLSVLMFLFVPKIIAVHYDIIDTSGKGGQIFHQQSNSQSQATRTKRKKKKKKEYGDTGSSYDEPASYLASSFVPGNIAPSSTHDPDAFEFAPET